MSEPTNELRAAWAAFSVEVFARQTRQLKPEDELPALDGHDADWWQEVMGDLLCDLQHLAGRVGLNWDRMLESSTRAYEEEVAEAALE